MMGTNYHGECTICHKHDYVRPLHDDKGGPSCCIMCSGKWHGEHGRRRRLGRIVIRAIKAYVDGGGKYGDVEKLNLSAMNGTLHGQVKEILGESLDPLGYLADVADTRGETIELTSELLADAIKIAHPDLHPPERRDLAHRVTQGLIALQPFTYPAYKPPPKPPMPPPAKPSATPPKPSNKPKPYPCNECKATYSMFYCTDCKTEYERRRQAEREKEAAQRRKWYANSKRRREWRRPPTICAACGAEFKGKRTDARFCSAACRQRGHRAVSRINSGRDVGPKTAVTSQAIEVEPNAEVH